VVAEIGGKPKEAPGRLEARNLKRGVPSQGEKSHQGRKEKLKIALSGSGVKESSKGWLTP